MKKTILHLFTVLATGCAIAQSTTNQWHATIKVLDEVNQPIPDARVEVWYYVKPPAGRSEASESTTGITDTNGSFSASHENTGSIDLGFRVSKNGYYPTTKGHELGTEYNAARWNPTMTLQLKKIGEPTPMYAKREETKFQKEAEPIGFDLTAGDWIPPFGTGKNADLFFTATRKVVSETDYEGDLKVSFPNPADGIMAVAPAPDTGSPLQMPRAAPEEGYQPQRTWHHTPSERPEPVQGYFFRVRTLLDESGAIKSALYGKVRGDVNFYVGTRSPHPGMAFTYYLNPKPNSRNVEFDSARNLFPGENVPAP